MTPKTPSSKSAFFALLCAAIFALLLPPQAHAAPVITITTSGTVSNATTFLVDGAASGYGSTYPIWYEVHSGSSTGELIDFGACAAKPNWRVEIRHLRLGTNVFTAYAMDSGQTVASATLAVQCTLDNSQAPTVRPRPRPTEVWWGGIDYMDQTTLNPNDWQFVQKYEDGFFFHGARWTTAYEDGVAAQLVALLTGSGALNAPAARFWTEQGGQMQPNMAGTLNNKLSWLNRVQGDGVVFSEITTDYNAHMDSFCQPHPDWPSGDILAWQTGDSSTATPGGPYLSGSLAGVWPSYINGIYAQLPAAKIGQVWSPVWWNWKDPSGTLYPSLAGNTDLDLNPLLDPNGNAVLVNGQPASFSFTMDQIHRASINVANAMPDAWHRYYAFASDCPHDYFSGLDYTGAYGFSSYSAALNRRKIRAYESWLHSMSCRHTLIANVSDAYSVTDPTQQNLYYKSSALDSMQLHQREGGRADRYLFESWYHGVPNQVTPETQAGTFTNLVKDAIKYIKGIKDDGSYETLKLSVLSNSGGQTVLKIANTGDVACLPAITVTESGDSHFSTAYFAANGSDASGALTAEGYSPSALVPAGGSITLTITATPTSGAPANATRTFGVEVFWNPQDPTGVVRDRAIVSLGAVLTSANVKANNTTKLNLVGSWTGGIVPGAGDMALWNNTVTAANTVSLGSNLSWAGISLANPGGLVTISSGSTLTLFAGGVDLSGATQNLTFSNTVSLGAPQTWNVAAGRNIQMNGTLTSGTGVVLTKTGSGQLTIGSTVNLPGTVSLASGTLSITTTGASIGALTGNGGILQSGGGTFSIGSANLSTRFAGGISGASNVKKTGLGTLTLAGSNSYSGGTTVSSGTLQLDDCGVLGTGVISNSATLWINQGTNLSLDIQGNGSVVKSGSGTFTKPAAVTETWSNLNVTGGAFAMSGGVLSVTSTFSVQGGTFQQSGGSMSAPSDFILGSAGPGSIVMTGGTLTHTGEIKFGAIGGGEGTLNVSGSASLNLNDLSLGSYGPGFINLDGGTLIANSMYTSSGFATIWFNGGVLRANTSPSNPWIDHSIPLLAVKNGGAIFDTNGKSVTIEGPLVAAVNSTGGLTKQGAGTLTLNSPNSYIGATTVSVGTLALSGSAAIAASGTIDVRSGAKLDVTGKTGGLTIGSAQTLIGSGTVAGNVTIKGSHRPGSGAGAAGKEVFSSGTLTYAPSSHLVWELITSSTSTAGTNYDQVTAGAVSFTPGAILDLSLSGSASTVDFTNSFWTTSHVWTVVASTAATGTPNIGSVSLDSANHSASSYGGFSTQKTSAGITLTWTPGAPTNTVSVVAATSAIAETSGSTAAFVVTRSGSTAASQVVYYSMGGSAVAGSDYVAISSVTIAAGATSGTVALTPIDNNLVDGDRTVTLAVSYGGTYLIGSPSTASLQLTDNDRLYSWTNPATSGTLAWSGSGNWAGGASAVSDLGSNLAFFAGATIASGTITANNDIANPLLLNVLTLGGTGAASAASNVTLTGGTLQLVANAGYLPVINLDAMIGNSGTLAYKVTNPVLLSATSAVQGDGNATFTFSGPIGGTGGIIKSGSSTLTLSGTNSFSGDMLINEGTVAIGGTASLPTSSNITVTAGGQLSIPSGTYSPRMLTLSGSGTALSAGALRLTGVGSMAISGSIALASGTTVSIVAFSSSGTRNLNGPITGNAPLTLFCGGAGITHLQTWVLGAASTFTGDTLVDSSGANGVLRLSGGDNRLPVGTVLTLNANWSSGSVWNYVNFDLNGCNQTLEGLVSTGSGSATVLNSGTNPATLTINALTDTTFAGTLVSGSSLSILKTGSGTWTLSGSSTFAGATTVSAGTLAVTGSVYNIASSGTIDVRSGATLDVTALTGGLTVGSAQTLMGSGTVAGNVSVAGSHRPGSVAGGAGKETFTSGTLTYSPSSHLVWELITSSTSAPGTSYDQVAAGAVSFGSGAILDISLSGSASTVDFTDSFWTTSHVWTVVSSTAGTGTPNIGSVSLDSANHGVSSYGGFSAQRTATGVTLTWNPGAPADSVSVVAATGAIAENSASTAAFVVTRVGSTAASQVVYYSMGGSAVAGSDYVATSSVTIPAGATSGTVALTPIDNSLLDGNRTVTLTISYGDSYLIDSPSSASLLLTDNERLYSWNNPATGGTLAWSGSGNWTGGSSAASDLGTNLAFFAGATLSSGTVTANNDIANPLSLNVLTLGGTGAASAVSNVTLTGGTLQLVANAGTLPVVNLDGKIGASGTLAYKVTNPVLLTATTAVQGDGNATFTFSGPISGTGGIIKSGSSTLTLTGTNKFSGDLLINGGVLAMSGTASLPTGCNITVGTGGQLSLLSTGTFSIGTLTLAGSGAGNNRGALYINATGSNTIPGAISLASGTTVRIGSFGSSGYKFLNGPISGNAALTLWCGGGGITQLQTWILGAASTYTGDTLVDASTGANGVLRLAGGDNRLPVGTSLTLKANWSSGGTWNYVNFDLNGCSQTLKGLSSAGAGSVTVLSSGTTPATLTINALSDTAFAGTLVSGSSLNIVKTGSGTWTLSGSSSFAGTTTVSAGTLALTGTVYNTASSGTIDIQAGAVLDGSGLSCSLVLGSKQLLMGEGTVAGDLTVSGTLKPGHGAGLQVYTGGLTLGSASHVSWELTGNAADGAGTAFDQITAGSLAAQSGAVIDLVLNSAGSTVDFSDPFWGQPQSWTVIGSSLVTGTVALGSVSNDPGFHARNTYGAFSIQQDDSGVNVVWTPVPNVVTLATTTPTAAEAGGAGVFTVSRTGNLTLSESVNYSIGGTAVAGAHYVALSGSVTIPASQANVSITVTAIDDLIYNPNETVIAQLIDGSGYTVGSPATGTITILDNELQPTFNSASNTTNPLPFSMVGGHMQVGFQRDLAATDITYTIEVSDNLVTWNPVAALAAGSQTWTESGATVTDQSGAVTAVDTTQAGGNSKRFFRVKFTRP